MSTSSQFKDTGPTLKSPGDRPIARVPSLEARLVSPQWGFPQERNKRLPKSPRPSRSSLALADANTFPATFQGIVKLSKFSKWPLAEGALARSHWQGVIYFNAIRNCSLQSTCLATCLGRGNPRLWMLILLRRKVAPLFFLCGPDASGLGGAFFLHMA